MKGASPLRADRAFVPSEEWRDVVGWEGRYQVSNLGRVRNAGGHVMAQHDDGRGYWQIGLSNGSGKVSLKVHRLVCRAFHGPCPEGCEVAHRDGVRTNASVDNLLWATPRENSAHKVQHGTRQSGERNGRSKLNPVVVASIRGMARDGFTMRTIARLVGVSKTQIQRVVSGEHWNAQ